MTTFLTSFRIYVIGCSVETYGGAEEAQETLAQHGAAERSTAEYFCHLARDALWAFFAPPTEDYPSQFWSCKTNKIGETR